MTNLQSHSPERLPRISVVTANFNGERFLEETIRSVVTQNYPDLEYIICDGVSTDRSVEIIRRFESSLAYWCSEKDKGQADGFHKGCKLATGDILYWLDSDDVLLPGALDAVGRYFLAHPKMEVVSAGCKYIDERGKLAGTMFGCYSLGVRASYRRFLSIGQDGVFQQGVFWKRSVYEAVGGIDTHWHFINDLDLFTRMARRRRFGRLPQIVALCRIHPSAKSSNIQHVRLQEIREWRASLPSRDVQPAKHFFLYCLYRAQSLVRKVWLAFLRLSRLVHV